MRKMGKMIRAVVVGVFVGLGLTALIAMLIAIPMWLLWNWLCPEVFGLSEIGLLQALGLALLGGCLFRSGHVRMK